MGGSADPGGSWEYGRVELLIDGVWTVIRDRFQPSEDIGRQGAQVLCRSLGYSTGAKIVAGRYSPFLAPPAVPGVFLEFSCTGTESRLSDCDASFPSVSNDYGIEFSFVRTVGVLCTTPSGVGCLRLVPWISGFGVAVVQYTSSQPAHHFCPEEDISRRVRGPFR